MESMSRQSLITALRASLHDASGVFDAPGDADFRRLLDLAALDLGRAYARTLIGDAVLTADQSLYAAPADLLTVKTPIWGVDKRRQANPWDKDWPGRLPMLRVVEQGGARMIMLDPAPTAAQIASCGSTYRYFYYAGHVVADSGDLTTVPPAGRGLLLLRAQAEAMKEMAMRNIGKPVAMRDGITQGARNGTPAALYAQLMEQFERAIA